MTDSVYKRVRILKRLYYKLIGMNPGKMPMVSYWKTKDHVEAKLTTVDGATVMIMDGEKYPMWGFPRGHVLIPQPKFDGEAVTPEDRIKKHGCLSVLKHEIKNQIFNEAWRKLEEGIPKDQIISEAWEALDRCIEVAKPLKYEMMPPQTMCPAVREIYRAWTKVAPSERSLKVRDLLTLILQEDDGYRYRVQWLALWMPWLKIFANPIKILDKALEKVGHGEVIGDMKERIGLLRRILMLVLEDPKLSELYKKLFKEINWKKVKLTEADRYHFRGKYFKVDMDVLEY